MRIRSTVKAATFLTISVVLIYSAVAVFINRTVETKFEDLRIASESRIIYSQLPGLTTDYVLYRTERAQRQWLAVLGDFLEKLKTPEYQEFQRKYDLEDLGDRLQLMGEAFGKLTATFGKTGLNKSEAEANQELQNRLITQISLTAREIVLSLNKVSEKIDAEVVSMQRRSNWLDGIAMLILILVILVNAIFLSRSVVQPVLKLHEGAEIIGAGNLDYRVETAGSGEILELSRAFNKMTANLENLRNSLQKSQEDLRFLASELITAQEKERQHLGLELHDDFGQLLMVLKFQLRAIQGNLPLESVEVTDDLENALNFINEIVERVRRLSRNLRPTVLEDMGLATGLKLLFEDFRKHHGLELTADMDDIQDLFPLETQLLIYRIFQESLTNVAKHAGAAAVAVSIKKQDGIVDFRMEDNGRGFNLQRVLEGNHGSRGLGLASVKERVKILGGDIDLWSQPGHGTRIHFTVPVTHSNL